MAVVTFLHQQGNFTVYEYVIVGVQECQGIVVPENIHTLSMEVFLGLNSPPLWKYQFRLILSFKNFGLLDPLLLGPSVVGEWIFSGTTHCKMSIPG